MPSPSGARERTSSVVASDKVELGVEEEKDPSMLEPGIVRKKRRAVAEVGEVGQVGLAQLSSCVPLVNLWSLAEIHDNARLSESAKLDGELSLEACGDPESRGRQAQRSGGRDSNSSIPSSRAVLRSLA
mmetsp:Transcript_18990/g.42927  ORF Transcript_18990/g.42927 Transcript_18990/m.42927 type:complete len:129 (-) Transcript_18990:7-393(-)